MIAIVSCATGKVVATYEYDAWGCCTVTCASGSTIGNVNPIRYRGYYYDAETGLYYLNSRYYDPELCRFISADDIAFLGIGDSLTSYNLYAYCLNNPINRIDPFGTWTRGISFGFNFNIYFGISISVGLFWDDKGNMDFQYSYAGPQISGTESIGIADAGAGLIYQYTNAETVYDLYGTSTYIGGSGGPSIFGGYFGFDVISLSNIHETDFKTDGYQVTVGVGGGADFHQIVAETGNASELLGIIFPSAKSTFSGSGTVRANRVMMVM